jgi:hypothetical protein
MQWVRAVGRQPSFIPIPASGYNLDAASAHASIASAPASVYNLDGTSTSVFYIDEDGSGVYEEEEEEAIRPSAPASVHHYENRKFSKQIVRA